MIPISKATTLFVSPERSSERDYGITHSVCSMCVDIWERPTLLTADTFSTDILLNRTNVYDSLWTTSISHVQSKLRSYCLFKKEFCLENYVMMFGHIDRSPFTKLRVSAHSLMIEKGHHFHPKIPPEQRLCKLCSLNEVEDEFHFMLKCTFYKDLRTKMMSDIAEIYDIDDMSDKERFILLMGFIDYDSILPVIRFVKSAFESCAVCDV